MSKSLATPKVNKLHSPKLKLTQSLLVATLTQNFMRFRFTVMKISSIPRYLVYSIKRLPTPKVNHLQSPKLRLTQALLVAPFTQNFMRFRFTVMEISSIPRYLVYSIKRLPTPKVNKLQSPKLRLTQALLVAPFTQNFMRFRFTVMKISSIPRYLVYSIKRLPTPKVNKLQSPKLRLTQSLLVATFTQNFMRFRCTVMEISSIPNYLVYSIKRLPTPKVNKLQSPKLRLT